MCSDEVRNSNVKRKNIVKQYLVKRCVRNFEQYSNTNFEYKCVVEQLFLWIFQLYNVKEYSYTKFVVLCMYNTNKSISVSLYIFAWPDKIKS